ncbi:MAG: DUF1501 domain-containing protein [Planctomycetes bacterium]|nr:DUF1501 domain-containing protein [Planctomycetota bacterium]
MLRILGHQTRACDGISRRELMRVGGLSLFGGVTLPRLLEAAAAGLDRAAARAKSVVLLNLFGGPSHIDMFDPKPEAPAEVRGEFKPIATSLPGLQICEHLPQTARWMDRATLIRSVTHGYNSHNPYNVLTGFTGGNDRENYFAKRTDHPSMGSVCQYVGIRPPDVPGYVVMPAHPGYSQGLRRAGPYGGYLGSQYDPVITMCDPKFERKGSFYDPVMPMGEPLLPSLDGLPEVTAARLDDRRTLLQQIDTTLATLDATRAVDNMTHFQREAFSLLTSAKTRAAFDLSREPPKTRDRYGRNLYGSCMLVARRLVEAGSTFVAVNWECAAETHGGHWDMHENNFGMLRVNLPVLDQIYTALVEDLDARGLLDSTLVVVMGEMGRTPKVNRKAGRDHWPQCGFCLLTGRGVKQGMVFGSSDKHAAYPVDHPITSGDIVATIYHLLGVDPHLSVPDLDGRPVHVAHGGSPILDVIV